MDHGLTILAGVTLVLCFVQALNVWRGNRQLVHLRDVPPLEPPRPMVSVIVAARNEARDIERAMRSMLALDYDPIQWIVVNDRSEDGTGQILDSLRDEFPQLEVIHIHELPPGWIGKNHALYCGAQRARGDWLLFSDADIVMQPDTLQRAVAYAERHGIDHLPMLFRAEFHGWLLEAFMLTFFLYFWIWVRPWHVRDPRSKAHIGAGGFNLIRREVYERIGTHRAIALRPDDDLKLGKLVKKHGFRQDVVMAADHVLVPGYRSVRETVAALEKNAFSGVDYRIWLVVVSSILILLLHAFPFLAVWCVPGIARWLYAATCVVLLGLVFHMSRLVHASPISCLGFPIAVVLFAFIQWRTMILNLAHGGLQWRGTFYSLADLKANKV